MPNITQKLLLFVIGPAGIPIVAIVVAFVVGGLLYTPPEASLKPEAMLLAAIHLSVKLDEHPPSGFARDSIRAFRLLKWHVLAFVVGGSANLSYDGFVLENDFRNMFLLAAVFYILSVASIVGLRQTRSSLRARLVIAPLWVFMWIMLGADGTTPRAGQLVNAGEDPVVVARGVRHGLMLRWHQVCDALLGDIGPE